MPNEPAQPHPPKAPLTDSPWFWLFLFGLAGVAALVAITPKYLRRQARIEQQYYANREILRRQAQGPGQHGTAEVEPKLPPARGELLVPLKPLLALLVILLLAAVPVWVLARRRRSQSTSG